MTRRAPYTVLIALTVATSSVPMYGVPFWQKLNPVPAAQKLSPFAHLSANKLIAQAQAPNAGGIPKSHLRGPGPHNGDWLRQYGALPPAQQEQKLQNDPMFRSLNPETQQHLLNRLRNFNSLTPDKKQKILNRMETFEHLPPEKQAQAQSLFKRYEGLPADQRGQVSQAYRQMRQMSPEQRAQFFNSDEFHGMNDEQRDLLRGMSELYPSQVR